jgi:hypothetical protein
VVGRDGWPSAEDEQRLPYIRAIIKEVRYETPAIYCLLLKFSIAICILRWSGSARRFGYHRRTIRQKTLYTTGCTSRRTRQSFSIAMVYIIMRRGIRIRTQPLTSNLRLISFNLNADECAAPRDRFAFKPERFLGDTLSCSESSNLPNAMDRDHWAFGAGCVQCVSCVLPAIAGFFPPLTFCSNAPQPSHLSSHPCRRKGAVSGHFAVALGVRSPIATR